MDDIRKPIPPIGSLIRKYVSKGNPNNWKGVLRGHVDDHLVVKVIDRTRFYYALVHVNEWHTGALKLDKIQDVRKSSRMRTEDAIRDELKFTQDLLEESKQCNHAGHPALASMLNHKILVLKWVLDEVEDNL